MKRRMTSMENKTDSFIQSIFIAPLQVHYYSEALPTQHGYSVRVSRRSATGNCKSRTRQSPYVAATAGVEPMTLRTKFGDSINAPRTPYKFHNHMHDLTEFINAKVNWAYGGVI